jgi:hypothetical protein
VPNCGAVVFKLFSSHFIYVAGNEKGQDGHKERGFLVFDKHFIMIFSCGYFWS